MDDLKLMQWKKKKRQREQREEKRKRRGQEHSISSDTFDERRKSNIGSNKFQTKDVESSPPTSKIKDHLETQIKNPKKYSTQRERQQPTPSMYTSSRELPEKLFKSSDRDRLGWRVGVGMKNQTRYDWSSDESSIDITEDIPLRKKQDDFKSKKLASSKKNAIQAKHGTPKTNETRCASEERSSRQTLQARSDKKSRLLNNTKLNSTTNVFTMKHAGDDLSSDESSVDLLEDAKHLQWKCKASRVKSNSNSANSKISPKGESPIRTSRKQKKLNDSIRRSTPIPDGDNESDSIERMEQKSIDAIHVSTNDKKKDMEASQESQRTCSLQPEKEEECLEPKQLDSLWSDSEGEEKVSSATRMMENKRKSQSFQSDKRTKQSTPNRKKVEQNELDEIESNWDENIDASELKPHFENPKFGPFELLSLILKHSSGEHEVPAAINRYLKDYQREGTAFMHGLVTEGLGAILGDDMGLGKTVQVISLLSALLEKKGCGEDEIELKRRNKINREKVDRARKAKERALREGTVEHSGVEEFETPKWSPILIIVPASVVENWLNEFHTWGHFAAVKFSGVSRERAFDQIENGQADILICCKSVFNQLDDFKRIKEYKKWKLIVVDEYHQYKNFRTISYKGLKSLKESCSAPIIGLTGTLMQNNHEELWSLVDLVNPGFLGTWEEFKDDAAVPIKMGRTKTASEDTIDKSEEVRQWLTTRLKSFYIQRLKSIELRDYLPKKVERVLFCPLSPLQKQLYEYILSLPDYTLLKYANSPCECGVNQKIFIGYRRMRTYAEKLAFQRNNRDNIVPRKRCCHIQPLNPARFDAGQELFDPRAPLWRWQHQSLVKGDATGEEENCKLCPYCIGFAALDKLYKLSSHVALLQVPKHPDNFPKDSRAWKEAQKAYDFAKVAFPDFILDSLPGRSLLRQDGIMNDHANLSGKMKVLAEVLAEFDRRGDRVLVFSFSTQMLDLIQSFVKSQGYSFLRLDGSTPPGTRQGLVDKYQRDQGIFLFLISTKAGGLGLNLCAANVIIVFDVDFNPSNDEQSQDRAYRIGQKKDVLVIRLVSRGTVEEIKYIRQIYKVQLRKDTIGSLHTGDVDTHKVGEGPRVFRGVHGDKDRKGELFGMENLLKYKDGSFMDDLWKSSSSSSSIKMPKGLERFGLRSNEDIVNELEGMSESEIDCIGGNIEEEKFKDAASKISVEGDDNDPKIAVASFLEGENAKNHEDFLRADKGGAVFIPGDVGFEEEMGGCSQAANFIMENAPVVDNEIPVSGTNDLTSEEASMFCTKSPNNLLSSSSAKTHENSVELQTNVIKNKQNRKGEPRTDERAEKPKKAKLDKPLSRDQVGSSDASLVKSKPRVEKTAGKGTTFTAKDFYMPRYTQKKKRRKK